MKKRLGSLIALLATMALVLPLAACGTKAVETGTGTPVETSSETPSDTTTGKKLRTIRLYFFFPAP